MKSIYRGIEIESKKEKCLGGWDEVYWTAYTVKEGYELVCGFGEGTVREMYKYLKTEVDRFYSEFDGDIDKHMDRE